ncbi:MAG: bifunctional demethylmenaquinone methyltransferase/2-methoxy-6-polyprenyl-1,4-benzoquinol methylase UbiE [Bacteroidales bacterium]|nr:bifunctional demethylmenaquinone methyltransferase/2-methoxy-6-polyprenyl-1,4-benzoquinol methylase UbiE [Bacteroidales bacterium]
MPKKEKIQKMFDGIAGDYDRLNHIMSLGIDRSWRRRTIKEIVRKGAAPGAQEILDIACGTGDFSIAIARAMAPGSRVTGLDLSEGMLAVMRAKLAAAGLEGRVACVQGDSEALPYADATFDCVTIAFGIRNFEHRETALREILRVLKPGGKLVILELSVPSNPVIRWFYKLYFTGLLPIIGGKISGDKAAYRYLPASVLNFPGRDEWMATMRACGYAGVRHKAFTLGICRMYIGLQP